MTNAQTEVQGRTYMDVMSVVVALTQRNMFISSETDWHSAWHTIAQMPEAEMLLSRVHFELREPYAPFSDQVRALLDVLRRSGILSTSLSRRPWRVEEADKKRVLLGSPELLKEHRSALQRMAERLDEELGV